MSLDNLLKAKEQYLKTVKESGQETLRQEFQEFFAANPTIQAIGWNQYTPYFNDGEACVFSTHGFYYLPSGNPITIDEDTTIDEEIWVYSWGSDEVSKNVSALEKKLEQVEDILESVFGDHVQVIATPDKFFISECSHD